MLLDVAGGALRARRVGARVRASVVDAGQARRAAAVPQADGHLGVAVSRAQADGLVIEHLARLLGRASLGGARVDAAPTRACAVRGAVFVS